MTATFFRKGEGRSINANIAEGDGKMPLTRAAAALAKQAGVTKKIATATLKNIGPCEWHHVGKFASHCDYYDVAVAADFLAHSPALAMLPAHWKDQISAAMTAAKEGTPAAKLARTAKCEEFATVCGLSAEIICDYYYTLKD